MKEYRKLDDSVTMRLNRNLAHFRDRDRESGSVSTAASSQNEACTYFWNQLVGSYDLIILIIRLRLFDENVVL